jgi:hypothetical protein
MTIGTTHPWGNDPLPVAIAAAKAAIHLDPTGVEAYLTLGHLLRQGRSLVAAERSYAQAVRCDRTYGAGDHIAALFYWGTTCLELGQWDAAIAPLTQAAGLAPDAFEVVYNLAQAHQAAGNGDAAIAAYLRAIALDPLQDKLYRQLGNLLNHLGRATEATDCYRQRLSDSLLLQVLDQWGQGDRWQHMQTEPEQAFVGQFSRGILWTPERCALVIDGAGKWILDVSEGPLPQWIAQTRANVRANAPDCDLAHPEPVPIPGRVFSLAIGTGVNYYHWMLEALPRLGIAQYCGEPWTGFDAIACDWLALPFHRESLELLGIAGDRLIECRDVPCLQADELITVNRLNGVSAMACQFLRRSFLRPDHPPPAPVLAAQARDHPLRLYLSRRQAPYRKLRNEAELIATLETHGFISVTLETLSLLDQAALLAAATAVVSIHGAGLTNLVFCDPGTRVLELFSPHYHPITYECLCQLQQLEYRRILGRAIAPDPNSHAEQPAHWPQDTPPPPGWHDFEIPLAEVLAALRSLDLTLTDAT